MGSWQKALARVRVTERIDKKRSTLVFCRRLEGDIDRALLQRIRNIGTTIIINKSCIHTITFTTLLTMAPRQEARRLD